jgi:tetratricopeptide (TPR) repeat protein
LKQAWIGLAAVAALLALVVALGLRGVQQVTPADTQCTTAHATSMRPPASLVTAADYLAQGDYDYERGDCAQAIAAYTRAIALDPDFAEAYNNRAYTYMRQKNYAAALPDLDRAVELRPTYVNALMNRGDIYNYYYRIDRQRAIADYDRVIELGGAEAMRRTSVCGHRMLAAHDGWGPGVFLQVVTQGTESGCRIDADR